MAKKSAGILPFRVGQAVEVFIVHPGGPFWARKDMGSWSIAKGEIDENEEPLEAARREFLEETGIEIRGVLIPLAPITQKSGKVVHAFAVQADFDGSRIVSNTFRMEWPRGSGIQKDFPEVDRAAWYTVRHARLKLVEAQVSFLDELMKIIPGDQLPPDPEGTIAAEEPRTTEEAPPVEAKGRQTKLF